MLAETELKLPGYFVTGSIWQSNYLLPIYIPEKHQSGF